MSLRNETIKGRSLLVLLLIGSLAGCTNQPTQIDSATRTPIASAPQSPGSPSGPSMHGPAIGENTIADIAQNAVKSVVNIDTSTDISVPDYSYGFGDMEFFFGPGMNPAQPKARRFAQHGTGSGVIIKPDGYILTNNHVIGQANEIKVTLNDNRVFPGKVIGRDSFTDLALVKIEATDLPTAQLGSAKQLRPGDWAIAIGSPVGLSHTVTLGIISALGRSLDAKGVHSDVGLVQTDAAINPGNSGGPLLNIHGDVVGLNTAIRADAQNIGFAIPIDVANEVSTQLLDKGSISRPYVGIYMQDLTPDMVHSLGLPADSKGVVVARVKEGSPADQAGLRPGDVIEKVEDKPVDTAKEVQQKVRDHKPGDQLKLAIVRNGQTSPMSLKIGDFPTESLSR